MTTCCLLDQLPAPLTAYKVQKYWQPIKTGVTLPVKGVVYDLFAGKQVATADGSVKLPVNLIEGDMRAVFAVPSAGGDRGVASRLTNPFTVASHCASACASWTPVGS